MEKLIEEIGVSVSHPGNHKITAFGHEAHRLLFVEKQKQNRWRTN